MIRIVFFICLTGSSMMAYGQSTQKPFFKLKADSVKYANIERVFSKWAELRFSNSADRPTQSDYDSLNRIQYELLKKAEWRWVYTSRKSFTSFADLKSGAVHPDSVLKLSIADLTSAQVPAEVLACKNLEELELVNTRIDELQPELNSLSKLTSVFLYNNVPSKRLALGRNDHVNYLRMAGYHPEKLPRSYKKFTSLDSLNINRSMADRLPNIKHNKQLTIINAVGNNIMLKQYKKSTSLMHLDLRMNKVTVVRNSISRKYPNLKALSFNANPLKKVKPGLGRLTQLEYLSFYGNMLSEIPAPVYKLRKLQVIDLFDNRIEFLSPEIKNLQSLKVLCLANNRLYRLPDEIGLLKNLEEVYVYNNRLDTLPATMDKLEKLNVLWVNDNFFHTVPATAWRVKTMAYLDASQNFIKQIPVELAQSKLSTLILSGYLIHTENENPELFKKLRQQGTKIIYYTAGVDEP